MKAVGIAQTYKPDRARRGRGRRDPRRPDPTHPDWVDRMFGAVEPEEYPLNGLGSIPGRRPDRPPPEPRPDLHLEGHRHRQRPGGIGWSWRGAWRSASAMMAEPGPVVVFVDLAAGDLVAPVGDPQRYREIAPPGRRSWPSARTSTSRPWTMPGRRLRPGHAAEPVHERASRPDPPLFRRGTDESPAWRAAEIPPPTRIEAADARPLRALRAGQAAHLPPPHPPQEPPQDPIPQAILQVHEMRTRGLYLCRPCHSGVHDLIDEKELGERYNTREDLLAHEGVARHVAWVAKQK